MMIIVCQTHYVSSHPVKLMTDGIKVRHKSTFYRSNAFRTLADNFVDPCSKEYVGLFVKDLKSITTLRYVHEDTANAQVLESQVSRIFAYNLMYAAGCLILLVVQRGKVREPHSKAFFSHEGQDTCSADLLLAIFCPIDSSFSFRHGLKLTNAKFPVQV